MLASGIPTADVGQQGDRHTDARHDGQHRRGLIDSSNERL